MKARISVIIPCYNQAQYLDECLQSVLDQNFKNWECIIVNDGSPDNTEEVAEKWLKKDSRFKYLFQDNKGVSAARNHAIETATGEWILPLDADDYISANYLELAEQHFKENDIKVIYCNARKFGNVNADFIIKDFTIRDLAFSNLIFCSAFFRKKNWLSIGGFDEELVEGYEDWEFWINLLKDGGDVLRLSEVCFFYRIKKESRNVAVMKKQDNSIKYIEKKHIDFFHKNIGTFHDLIRQNLQNTETLDYINRRFLSRVINKLYLIKENLFNNPNI